MSHTDEGGSVPVAAPLEKSQCAVVEATTHTQSVAHLIESDQRQQYQIQSPRCDASIAAAIGFIDTKAVFPHALFRVVRDKPERIFVAASEYRKVELFSITESTVNNWGWIEFSIAGVIERDGLIA